MKIYSLICFKYRAFWMLIFDVMDLVRKRLTKEDFMIKREGASKAAEYIKSKEYDDLPPVKRIEIMKISVIIPVYNCKSIFQNVWIVL